MTAVRRLLHAALGVGLAACAGSEAPASRDLLLVNGKVFTASTEKPWAEAILIHGERIIGVGTSADLKARAPRDVRLVDLEGRVVVPGFNDAHDHIGAAEPAVQVATVPDPLPEPSFAVVRDSLVAAVARHPAGTRLEVMVGERVFSDPDARRATLDRIAPSHPVVLVAWTGHGKIYNSAALTAAGVSDTIRDPLGGRFERSGGKLTGLIEEYAGFRLMIPKGASEEATRAAFRARADSAVRVGITSIQDMTTAVEPEQVSRLADSLDLPVRLRLIRLPLTTPAGREIARWRAIPTRRGGRVTISGTKYILDGTPVERLATLRAPYADRRGWYGRLDFPPDTLKAALAEILAAGDQPIIHAVGDSAVALVLSTLTQLAPDSVWRRLRPRIEHGEGMAPDLYRRALELGVVVVQNPTHLGLGSVAAARYGPDRMKVLQPLKSLLREGIVLGLASDGPQNPFLNLMLAVIHPDNPAEKLTMEEAVRAYTHGSAWAEYQEGEKGRIEPGLLADLAVLSQDIFAVPVNQVPATRSVLTLVGGRPVFDPNGWLAGKTAR